MGHNTFSISVYCYYIQTEKYFVKPKLYNVEKALATICYLALNNCPPFFPHDRASVFCLDHSHLKREKNYIFICCWLWLSSDKEDVSGMYILKEKVNTFTLLFLLPTSGVQKYDGWSWSFILDQTPVGNFILRMAE